MATVAQVAKASLQRILVQASEAALEPDEYQDYIFALNNYMLALDADGISLGFTEVNNLGDEVTVPVGALRGVIANVAIECSPDYNGQVTQALMLAASDGLKTMRKLGQIITSTRYSSTLPVGSGNESGNTRVSGEHFYVGSEAEILAETTGCIALETGTDAAADGDDISPVDPTSSFVWLSENGGEFLSPLTFLDDDNASYTIPDQFLDENNVPYTL